MKSLTALNRLQEWYVLHCDGDREHSWGIKIETLDNPGWRVQIDLQETGLESRVFETLKVNYDHPTDWLICEVKEGRFLGRSGAAKLEEVLEVFLSWAEKNEPAR